MLLSVVPPLSAEAAARLGQGTLRGVDAARAQLTEILECARRMENAAAHLMPEAAGAIETIALTLVQW